MSRERDALLRLVEALDGVDVQAPEQFWNALRDAAEAARALLAAPPAPSPLEVAARAVVEGWDNRRVDGYHSIAQAVEALERALGEGASTHALRHGDALCGLPGVPGDWPPGHLWVSASDADAPAIVTCEGCRARLRGEGDAQTQRGGEP